ncbi:uncharacterized protein LOC108682462 [Hyalella azteca]|uniref:Uncharacterized protein LOC108682462 n=1 Tax=Hyalella azteca TaxID=294128 RepID=A0A8B7PNV7_HYAAZ|nr:uncharacterized protein LOC108682462 [Hyalella azteca]
MVFPTMRKIKKSKMFSGITNYLWGSPNSKPQESMAPFPSCQAPDEIFGDLKSMEVTSDLEEGLQTPLSPSDVEEDWVVLSGNGRVVEALPKSARNAPKKLKSENHVARKESEVVHELDNRLDDLPETEKNSLQYKSPPHRDSKKTCTRTEDPEEKLRQKEREHELAMLLEELKPAQKAHQKQEREKLSRKALLKTNLIREVAASGRSRLRRSDRLTPSTNSCANNNRKCHNV